MLFPQFFSRKKKIISVNNQESLDGFYIPKSGEELINTPRRQEMIKVLWDLTSQTKTVFNEFIYSPIRRYAELVQLLPASESHHHSYPGGMLDHALEAACFGLRLRQKHLLPPGAKPEEQSSAAEVWTVAVIYGALMHDIAKALVDIEIKLRDGSEWYLWDGVIPSQYQFRYKKGRNYHLHSAVNPLLCHYVLEGQSFKWLMSQPKLFEQFMYTISGHSERGGIIAELVHQADRASVAKALGGDPVQALSSPVESIQRKLAEGLRYLVKEQWNLNKKGAIGWLTEDGLWLVSPRAVNELKAHLYDQGIKSIPADLNRLYGELQSHGIIEEVSEGKSVWKCKITEGDWSSQFNMIKVSPTLIWGVEEKPSFFSGQLAILGEGAVEEKNTEKTPKVEKEKKEPKEPKEAKEPKEPLLKPSSQSTSPKNDDMDEILEMFSGENCETRKEHENEKEETEELVKEEEFNDEKKHEIKKRENISPENDIGNDFLQWLKDGIADHSIIINDTKAMVHTVNRTFFLVSPGIFKRYCKERMNDVDSSWTIVQKKFQKLGLHIKEDGKNIHTVSVEGQNKQGKLMGYVIKDPSTISNNIPLDNWVLSLQAPNGEEKRASHE